MCKKDGSHISKLIVEFFIQNQMVGRHEVPYKKNKDKKEVGVKNNGY